MCLLKTLILTLSLVVLSACGKYEIHVDERIAPYVQRFEQDMGVKVTNIHFYLNPLKNNLSGTCVRGGTSSWITIDTEYWNTSSDLSKEETIYHELGHCLFGYDHIDNIVNIQGYNFPGSIMYHGTIGHTWHYALYHDLYIKAFRRNTVIHE